MTIRRMALGLVLSLGLASVGAAADFDGDFVEDGLDNCWQVPNPSQRNSDRDAYGDACDPDLDQDGQVDAADVDVLTAAFYAAVPTADFDEDGRVDFADLARLRTYFGGTPGPATADTDGDGDGDLDANDRCPRSRGAGRSLFAGCGFADLSRRARAVLTERPDRALQSLRDAGVTGGAFDAAFDEVEALRSALDGAETAMSGGDACGAVATIEQARDDLESELISLDALIEAGKAAVWASAVAPEGQPGIDYEDFHGVDRAIEPFDVLERRSAAALASMEEARTGMQAACDEIVGTSSSVGLLADYDAIAGFAQLDDGREIALVPRHTVSGSAAELAAGIQVAIHGHQLADGSEVGLEIETIASLGPVSIPVAPCLQLQIVPNQATVNGQKPIRHDPDAYLAEGVLRLEGGMGFAVTDAGCPVPTGVYLVRSAELRMLTSGGAEVSLAPGGEPYFLSTEVDWSQNYVIQLRTFASECGPLFPGSAAVACSEQVQQSEEFFSVQVVAPGFYCELVYSGDEFFLDAPSAPDFAITQLEGVQLFGTSTAVDNPTTRPTALGWRVHGVSTTSYPQTELIETGDAFAIYPWDFGDGWNGAKSDAEVLASHGTLERAGLVWPGMEGTHDGHPFRYSCQMPEVVRDGISDCGSGLESTYHTAPLDETQITQEPNGEFSHLGDHAWDMRADSGTPIFATRAGVVSFMRENSIENCTSLAECKAQKIVGNGITIDHEDGTRTSYWHLIPAGALVDEGDRVVRGQHIGYTGNTGFSTGPHLHLQNDRDVPGLGWLTGLGRFHASMLQIPWLEMVERTCWQFEEDDFVFRIK